MSLVQESSIASSPLFEYGPGEALPGILKLEEILVCNDAAILSKTPLVVSLPTMQWAFGLLMPLNNLVLPSSDTGITLNMNVSVRNGGALGIAGVDETFGRLTTREQIVRVGEADVTLTIPNPAETYAIVLRNADDGGHKPEVTITDVLARRPDKLQLAPRHHDLGYDMFVILSMGKAATQTVEQTLLSLSPTVQVRRTHCVSPASISYLHEVSQDPSLPPVMIESVREQAHLAERIRAEIEGVYAHGGKIAFLSGIREPISQIIADIFQLVPDMIPGLMAFHKKSPKLLGVFADYITAKLDCRAQGASEYQAFFERELRPVSGIDVLSTPLPKNWSHAILGNGSADAFLYKFETITSSLSSGLTALTGRPDIEIVSENLSARKAYAEFYKLFLETFQVPGSICSALYSDPYVRHFYSDAEINAFKARWKK